LAQARLLSGRTCSLYIVKPGDMNFVAILSLCTFASASAVVAAKDHPVVKVIKLLEGLKETAISEGKQEAVAYEKFTYWCSTSKAELNQAIADETETIDELKDTIAGKVKAKESLEGKISELEDQLTELQASSKSAKDDRAAENKLYEKANTDLASTIKAVEDCIKALEGAETSTEGKLLLAQHNVKSLIALVSSTATQKQLEGLKVFAQGRPKQLAEGNLESHTDKYDFKSENVVELLKQLKLKFEDDKLETVKAETNALNAYELSKSARDNTITAAEKSKKKQVTELADTEADLVTARKNKKDTESDLDSDSKALSATNDSCSTKKSEWEERSATRKNEIAAINAAVEIMSKATGVRTEAPGNPIPPASPVTFFQAGQTQMAITDPKMKAVALLREAAEESHSKALERLAMEVKAHLNGPFDAVNNMIQKMIFRLKDEQTSEDEHKLWCDEEIDKTYAMQEDKGGKIRDLKAKIKVETASVAQLTEDIKTAGTMLSDIDSFMKEATEIRNTGKKENALAIKDAQDAQKAVSNAIAVLEAFYKESGSIKKESWELLQAPVKLPKDPATWSSPYTEVSDPKKQPGGIVSILEAVSADFSLMEGKTKSQESVDQAEYESAMKTNKIEKARRTKESEMKTAEKSRRTDKITHLQSSKKDTAAEKEKTEQYLVDLKPACEDTDKDSNGQEVTYDMRKASRTKEIEALKQAQVTLTDAFKAPKKFLQIRAVRHAQ